MIDQELINKNDELLETVRTGKLDERTARVELMIQLTVTNANYKAVIEANADLYAENALLKSQASDMREMLVKARRGYVNLIELGIVPFTFCDNLREKIAELDKSIAKCTEE